ncbi:Transcription factor GTE6, partial [Mucuna pruriens]
MEFTFDSLFSVSSGRNSLSGTGMMETLGASISEVRSVATGISNGGAVEMEGFKQRVDEIVSKVDKASILEKKVHDIDNFYSSMNKKQTNMPKGNSATKDKDKEKHVPSIKKQQQDASRREVAASKRMQDLMRQFGTILRQATTFH